MTDRPYIVICGHGRSGSNRILDTLDQHPDTLCRNEPNEIEGATTLAALPDGFFVDSLPTDFMSQWEEAFQRTSLMLSERDRIGETPKSWTSDMARAIVGRPLLTRKRVRKALGVFSRGLGQAEWSVPSFYANRRRLQHQGVPVLKILQQQAWVLCIHERDTHARIVHNIRDPKSFLKSWANRYMSVRGAERNFADNLKLIPPILKYFGISADRFSDFNQEALFESELWIWRYVNETVYTNLSGSERYHLVLYDDFTNDPVTQARAIYRFCELEITEDIEACIRSLANPFDRWDRAKGIEHDHDMERFRFTDPLIEKVLKDSPLRGIPGLIQQ